MIHTLTVPAGENDYAVAAQQHALEWCRLFKARLRVVAAFDADQVPEGAQAEGPAELAEKETRALVATARDQGLTAEGTCRGEGVVDGLLNEARDADLLILGIPTLDQAREDRLAKAILNQERPLFEQAESMVLAVCDPPQPVQKLLVNYQGGALGKQALRIAGEMAQRGHYPLVVVSIERDVLLAESLVTSAEKFIEGYELAKVETVAKRGEPSEESDILDATEEVGANYIVISEEPRGLVSRFLLHSTAEGVAMATRLPVLIAR